MKTNRKYKASVGLALSFHEYKLKLLKINGLSNKSAKYGVTDHSDK